MNVLIACEESQAVCIEFRKLGHEAYSADIQECSGGHPEWHIMGDCLPLINGNCEFDTMDKQHHVIVGQWDVLIAHPPCTYMSKAGARFMYPTAGNISLERYKKAMNAKDFFMLFYNADCDKICIENQTPLKCVELPIYSQVIQPYQFGHKYSKRTLLWLKGLNNLVPTNIIEEYTPYVRSNTAKFYKGTGKGSRGNSPTAKDRSKTFSGIARAMAEQWGKFLESEAKHE